MTEGKRKTGEERETERTRGKEGKIDQRERVEKNDQGGKRN